MFDSNLQDEIGCEEIFHDEENGCLGDELEADDRDEEPQGSHDLSDDGDALASAGFGTDEDYGGGDTPLGDEYGGE